MVEIALLLGGEGKHAVRVQQQVELFLPVVAARVLLLLVDGNPFTAINTDLRAGHRIRIFRFVGAKAAFQNVRAIKVVYLHKVYAPYLIFVLYSACIKYFVRKIPFYLLTGCSPCVTIRIKKCSLCMIIIATTSIPVNVFFSGFFY